MQEILKFRAIKITIIDKKCLTFEFCLIIFCFAVGGIAQLGERLNGIQKVSGSIPLTSTNFLRPPVEAVLFHGAIAQLGERLVRNQ